MDELKIGQPFQGGFYAGDIVDDGVTYHLVIASEKFGRNYGGLIKFEYSVGGIPDGVQTTTNGLAATLAMVHENEKVGEIVYLAAQYCHNLEINGYKDWYLPARDELAIAYRNLKPDLTPCCTARFKDINKFGFGYGLDSIENGFVPSLGYGYAVNPPNQTSSKEFQTNGTESFYDGYFWTSTPFSFTSAWVQNLRTGQQRVSLKKHTAYICAFRRVRKLDEVKPIDDVLSSESEGNKIGFVLKNGLQVSTDIKTEFPIQRSLSKLVKLCVEIGVKPEMVNDLISTSPLLVIENEQSPTLKDFANYVSQMATTLTNSFSVSYDWVDTVKNKDQSEEVDIVFVTLEFKGRQNVIFSYTKEQNDFLVSFGSSGTGRFQKLNAENLKQEFINLYFEIFGGQYE